MRKNLFAVFLVAIIVHMAVLPIHACGDKALRIGRGIRFQRTSHPLAVLICFPSNLIRASQLQSFLTKIGHKPYTVETADRASTALRSGQYDLIFTDFASAASLQEQISASASKVVLVPVVSEGTKAAVAAAQKQYKLCVKNPNSADS
jgi:hypothetical protein